MDFPKSGVASLDLKKFKVGDFLPNAGPIVLTTSGWVELECHICMKNTNRYGTDYLKGLSAFHRHLYRGHGLVGLKLEDVLRLCQRRQLSDADVVRLLSSKDQWPIDSCQIGKPPSGDNIAPSDDSRNVEPEPKRRKTSARQPTASRPHDKKHTHNAPLNHSTTDHAKAAAARARYAASRSSSLTSIDSTPLMSYASTKHLNHASEAVHPPQKPLYQEFGSDEEDFNP